MSTDTKHLLRGGGPCLCGDPGCPKCFGEPPEEIDGDALAAEVRRTRDGIIAQAARLIRLPVEDPADAETVRQVVVALTGLADGLKASEDALAETPTDLVGKVATTLGRDWSALPDWELRAAARFTLGAIEADGKVVVDRADLEAVSAIWDEPEDGRIYTDAELDAAIDAFARIRGALADKPASRSQVRRRTIQQQGDVP